MRLRPKKSIQNDFFVGDMETGNQRIPKGKKFPVIDWELCARPEKFVFACVVGKNYRKEFHSLDELHTEFKKPEFKNKKVFFHNGGKYDYHVFCGNVVRYDPKALFNGKLICFTNGNCLFADSLNIIQNSVKEIGRMLGHEKTGMDAGNYKRSDWNKKGIRARDINGCYRDCEIIYDALCALFEDASAIRITQASLAMSYYRRFHQPYDIEHNEYTKFFFDSYFGGRTECFKIGKTHATVIDRNSMYPAEMATIKFPNPRTLRKTGWINPKSFIEKYLYEFEGLVYATVEHKKHRFGFLPVKKDGKLLFPVGNFSGCWNFNEFRFALENKMIKIKSISRVVYGQPMETPFKGFVDHLYQRRLASLDEFEKYRLKIFMNSLYGKFAQRITAENIYIADINKELNLIRDYQKRGLFLKLTPFNAESSEAWLTVKPEKKIDISFCIPSFASYITSAARVNLLKKMLELQNLNVVYCDTDSVFFEINPGNLKNQEFLGGWKIEKKIISEIRGLKNYRFFDPEKVEKKNLPKNFEFYRLKGVPANAEKISENTYIYNNLVNTKEALRRGLEPGILIERKKVISGKYDKRVVLPNGETEPIILTHG